MLLNTITLEQGWFVNKQKMVPCLGSVNFKHHSDVLVMGARKYDAKYDPN